MHTQQIILGAVTGLRHPQLLCAWHCAQMSRAVFRIWRRLTAFPTADDLETVGAGFNVLSWVSNFPCGSWNNIWLSHLKWTTSKWTEPCLCARCCCVVLHNLVCLQNRNIVDPEVVRIMTMTNLNPETQASAGENVWDNLVTGVSAPDNCVPGLQEHDYL